MDLSCGNNIKIVYKRTQKNSTEQKEYQYKAAVPKR